MNKKISIIGGGKSGIGACLLGKKYGYQIFLSDKNLINPTYKKILLDNNIAFEEGKHSMNKILLSHEIIKSPGIPSDSKIMKKIYLSNIPVISELSFALRYTKAKIIAITGTNGKTTTSHFIYKILKYDGFNVGIAGNIGISLSNDLLKNKYDYYVLEISSYQLDDLHNFNPYISIILNITEDHLDRYNNKLINYFNSKIKICINQNYKNYFIYNGDDVLINNFLLKNKIQVQCIPFSKKKKNKKIEAYFDKNQIIINNKNKILEIPQKNINIKGIHNIYNIMAILLVATLFNVKTITIKNFISKIKNIEHRLEFFINIKNIQFINDSKSTNIASTLYALKSINSPIIWIVGGIDKGNNYNLLKYIVKTKVKVIICLGLNNKKIIYFFQKIINIIVDTKNMKEAVYIAYMLSRKNDSILLSPACSSFDLFKNYKDRGDQFKKEVISLINENY